MHTFALVISFLTAMPLDVAQTPTNNTPVVETQKAVDAEISPVIIKTQARRRRTTTARPVRQRRANRNPILAAFWTVFAPPGNYHYEIGFAGGIDYLETAYGGSNPNAMYQLHFGMRPDPKIPVQILATVDYSNYEQSAGPLSYNSRYLGGYAGGGLVQWIGGLRLNADLGVGGQLRVASQDDGNSNGTTAFAFSPSAMGGIGMGISVLGHAAITLKAQARVNTPYRLSYNVLFGLDWMIDAKPVKAY